ncbi:unnamed protein product, partial [Phaeothamnion confervicola]
YSPLRKKVSAESKMEDSTAKTFLEGLESLLDGTPFLWDVAAPQELSSQDGKHDIQKHGSGREGFGVFRMTWKEEQELNSDLPFSEFFAGGEHGIGDIQAVASHPIAASSVPTSRTASFRAQPPNAWGRSEQQPPPLPLYASHEAPSTIRPSDRVPGRPSYALGYRGRAPALRHPPSEPLPNGWTPFGGGELLLSRHEQQQHRHPHIGFRQPFRGSYPDILPAGSDGGHRGGGGGGGGHSHHEEEFYGANYLAVVHCDEYYPPKAENAEAESAAAARRTPPSSPRSMATLAVRPAPVTPTPAPVPMTTAPQRSRSVPSRLAEVPPSLKCEPVAVVSPLETTGGPGRPGAVLRRVSAPGRRAGGRVPTAGKGRVAAAGDGRSGEDGSDEDGGDDDDEENGAGSRGGRTRAPPGTSAMPATNAEAFALYRLDPAIWIIVERGAVCTEPLCDYFCPRRKESARRHFHAICNHV